MIGRTPRRLTIAGLAWGLAMSMVAALLVLLVSTERVIHAMADVSRQWDRFDVIDVIKTDCILDIQRAMGFGGLSQSFRAFQTQGRADDRAAVERNIQLVRDSMSAYRGAGDLDGAESMALDQISAVLTSIETKLPQIEALHRTQMPLTDLIATTAIDPAPAIEGLSELSLSIARQRNTLNSQASAAIERADRITRSTTYGIDTVLLALAVASVWFIRQRILQPLKRLGHQSSLLAGRQLDESFEWRQADEMGDLGRILDGSRLALKSLFADVEANARRLQHQATHDALTGLPNRIYLLDWLATAMVTADGRRTGNTALLFFDLDGFKGINDTLGHAVGDKVLIAVGQRIAATLDGGAFVSRLGGDEFVVAIPRGDEAAAFALAAKIDHALREPYAIDGMELTVSASVGIAVDDGSSLQSVDLLRDADIAVYRAKESGGGRQVLFNTTLREAILIRRRLQQDLAAATRSGEIYLVYQPITAIEGSRLVGFEALVRWQHPELGAISPVQFIPIAEETGQILPLGRFVLEKAAATAEGWRSRFALDVPLTVNVNLSPRQMWDDSYVAEMLTFLQAQAPGLLKIEVTEGMTVNNPDIALAMLRRFRAIGIPTCIDDFGTGYSSLSYLHRFPFDVLKIDKSFVSDLPDSPEKSRLVRSIIQMAHDLGMHIVAEGVETEAELARLRDYGCDFCQGYLFSRPLLEADALTYILARYPDRIN